MDFYNPLYWTIHSGAYTLWHSVYPPLNFIFLGFFETLLPINLSSYIDSEGLRELMGKNILYLLGIYSALIFLTIQKSFSHIFNQKIVLVIFVIAILSPPSLFAMERGNLIFLSVYFFALYVFSKNDFQKILAFSILVNLKPYFILVYFLELLRCNKENKQFLLLAPIASFLVLLITGIIFNQEYYLLPFNILNFSSNAGLSPQEIFALPTTIAVFGYLNELNGNQNIDRFVLFIPNIIIYFLLIIGAYRVATNQFNKDYFLIFIGFFITSYSINAGGYSALYYLPILGLLYINREYIILLIIVFTLFIGFWDMISLYPVGKWEFDIFLSGMTKEVVPSLSLGAVVRPIGNLVALLIFFKKTSFKNYAKNNKI